MKFKAIFQRDTLDTSNDIHATLHFDKLAELESDIVLTAVTNIFSCKIKVHDTCS